MPRSTDVHHGFVRVDRVRCPACEDRDALRNDGGAKIIGGGQLRGSTRDVGITRASVGCEICNGKGSISTNDPEALLRAGITEVRKTDRDPYSMPLSPEQAAKLTLRQA
jgi:hypothetical protein